MQTEIEPVTPHRHALAESRRALGLLFSCAVVLTLVACQGSMEKEPREVSTSPLTEFEAWDVQFALDWIEREAEGISELEHEFQGDDIDFSNLNALQSSPQDYAKSERDAAINTAVHKLYQKAAELRKEKEAIVEKLRVGPPVTWPPVQN